MLAAHEIETAPLKQCESCQAELLARDKFCRRCGLRQVDGYATSTNLTYPAQYETKALSSRTESFPSYSGQLIKLVAKSLSERETTEGSSRALRRLVCTLITIPIWMLIVMLSPLDAVAAAKAASGYVNQR
jgi:hypothetical protein